jgi:hypothetical protein
MHRPAEADVTIRALKRSPATTGPRHFAAVPPLCIRHDHM